MQLSWVGKLELPVFSLSTLHDFPMMQSQVKCTSWAERQCDLLSGPEDALSPLGAHLRDATSEVPKQW